MDGPQHLLTRAAAQTAALKGFSHLPRYLSIQSEKQPKSKHLSPPQYCSPQAPPKFTAVLDGACSILQRELHHPQRGFATCRGHTRSQERNARKAQQAPTCQELTDLTASGERIQVPGPLPRQAPDSRAARPTPQVPGAGIQPNCCAPEPAVPSPPEPQGFSSGLPRPRRGDTAKGGGGEKKG